MFYNNIDKLKIAVVHDHLAWSGGGERTALLMALGLKADFITAYANKNTFAEHQRALGKHLIILTNKLINIRGLRFFYIRWLYWHHRKLFKKYDVLIASGQSAMEAVAFYALPQTSKLLYNHTQPRRVFDLYEISRQMYHPLLRPIYSFFAWNWKHLYLHALARIDINIANSQNVRQRAWRYTKQDVHYVVWPPILTNKFTFKKHGDYFLSWARTDEAKRVELLVKAFTKMPDKKLIVASGGPRLEIIKKLASKYSNIQVLGWVNDKKLFQLVGSCQAVLYIPIDEDAGMTPLEANAAGKPVLGVREGGLKEIIINNKTGLLIKANPDINDIQQAVKQMTPSWCQARRDDCIIHAQNYSLEHFIQQIKTIIANRNLPTHPLSKKNLHSPNTTI